MLFTGGLHIDSGIGEKQYTLLEHHIDGLPK